MYGGFFPWSMGPGCHSLILIDALSSDCWKEKRKREKKKKKEWQGAFSPGLDTPSWLCCRGFFQLLGAIKG
jgi:hypothetical protein